MFKKGRIIDAWMKYTHYFLMFLCCWVCFSALGQEDEAPRFKRELHLTVDNDAMLFGKNDRYYSSGIFASYRRLLSADRGWFKLMNKKDKLSKAIVTYQFAHRMYTPYDIKYSEEAQIDRPYAGWVNLGIGMHYYFKKGTVLRFDYDLGWLGPGTKTGEIQRWWHNVFNMKRPRGWQYQINNTIATNVSVMVQKNIVRSNDSFDLISNTSVQFGTIMNNAKQGLTIRLGQLSGLDNTSFSDSKMGQRKMKVSQIPLDKRIQELYFFVNFTVERVFYNTTIEGNFIGEQSHFTKVARPWVYHHSWGFSRSGRMYDLTMALNFRSREVVGAQNHKYMTITMAHRF